METTQKLLRLNRSEIEKARLRLQEQEQRYKKLQEACEKERKKVVNATKTLRMFCDQEELIAAVENGQLQKIAGLVPTCSASFMNQVFPELLKILSQENRAVLHANLKRMFLIQEDALSDIDKYINRHTEDSYPRKKSKGHPFDGARQLIVNDLERIKEALKAFSPQD